MHYSFVSALVAIYTTHPPTSAAQLSPGWHSQSSRTVLAPGRDLCHSKIDSCVGLHHHQLPCGPWSTETTQDLVVLRLGGQGTAFTNTAPTSGNVVCYRPPFAGIRNLGLSHLSDSEMRVTLPRAGRILRLSTVVLET
jgi:hypothetical protein